MYGRFFQTMNRMVRISGNLNRWEHVPLLRKWLSGLQLISMDRPIRALPARANWLYYEVKQAATSPAWRDVQETQTLALRLRDSLIMNRDRLQGERKLVVSARGKPVTLQFALFAVPIEK